MKKLMALCLAMLMALSMVSFSVMAEGEAVLFEDIANGQIPEFVTGNLTFPEGAVVTSSNEAVIALDGTVNRSLFNVEDVTLTVNGTSFAVKVQPKTIVGVSEIVSFEDYDLENGAALGTDQGWTVSTSSAGKFAAEYVVDGTNSYAKLGFTNNEGNTSAPATTSAITYTFSNEPGIQNARYYVMKAKVNAPIKPSSGFNMNLTWGGVKAGEFMFGSAGWPGKLYGGALRTDNTWHTRGTAVNNTRNKNVPTTGFVDLTIRIDKELGKVEYYQNGLLTETVVYDAAAKTYVPDFTTDKAAKVIFPIRTTTAHIFIDDIYVYAETTADGVIGTLPDQERADYYKNLVLANQLTANGKYVSVESDLNLVASPASTANVTIAYESSDPSVIANDGKVTLVNSLIPRDVTFTATITAGDVVETVPYYLQVAQAGTTYVSTTDFENKAGTAGYVTDENPAHGTVLHKNAPSGSGTLYAGSGVSGGGFADRMVISADVKYAHDRTAGVMSNYGGVQVNGIQGADSCAVLFNFKGNNIGFNTSDFVANESGTGIRGNDIATLWLTMPEFIRDKEGEWMNVVFDFNIMSQTYEVYVDGVLVTPHPIVRRNAYKTDTTSNTLRGVTTVSSAAGDVWLDNVSVRRFDATVAEVNAALNAAAVLYASDLVHPVLTNRELAPKTISKSWIKNNSDFYKAETDLHNNPARYTLQTDGPSITYKINGEAVTAIDVDSPQTVEFTITATSVDGTVTESKTFTKKIAPAAIRGLGLNGVSAFNGLWVEGIEGAEKVVIAQYNDDKLVLVKTIDFVDNTNYVASTGIIKNISTQHPVANNGVDQIKIFIVGADGITPLAYANTALHD